MKTRTIPARLLPIGRYLRWGALLGVVLVCVVLARLTVRVRQDTPAPSDGNNALLALRDFRTEIYQNGIRVRISGAAVTVSPARLAGPFRLGFAHELVGRHLTLELFPQDHPRGSDRRPTSARQILGSLAPSLSHLALSGVPGQSGISLVQAECGPLTILSHERGETLVVFSAERCRTNFGLTKVRCTGGMIRQDESNLSFQELTYTGRLWQLLTVDGRSRQFDELLNWGIGE